MRSRESRLPKCSVFGKAVGTDIFDVLPLKISGWEDDDDDDDLFPVRCKYGLFSEVIAVSFKECIYPFLRIIPGLVSG